jgi:quercetin dioxygenase-like cupin family protein
MNQLLNEEKVTHPFPGLTRRILTHSDKSMLVKHVMEADSVFPWHSHPHEQTVYILEGELIVEAKENGTVRSWKAFGGDSWVIPGDVPHQVTALKRSVALDYFVPFREDYV